MEFGICSVIENISLLEKSGVYKIELNASAISMMSEDEFCALKKTLEASNVKADVCNGLILGKVKPLFEDEELRETEAYLRALMPKLSEIGTKIVVFGSGTYRRAPENLSPLEKFDKMTAFFKLLSEITAEYGICVAIEPLNRKETNIIMSTGEAVEYIDAVKADNLKLLVDLYHFKAENEDFADIVKYKQHIKHIHIAKPVQRSSPKTSDGYDYSLFFNALKAAGYDGIVSLEAGISDLEKDLAEAKAVFNRLTNI